MIATGLFGTWRTGSGAEPPGLWDRLLIGSSITDWVMAAVTGVRQGSVRHLAAVKGTATGGQRNGYTDCQ